MQDTQDFTAWSCLLLGLFTLSVGIGALRRPDIWRATLEEIGKSPALQLTSALVELVVGSLVYLANPWVPADILACIAKFVGGAMIFEGLVIAGFCDIYTTMWLKFLGHQQRGWALYAVALGLGLSVPAMLRFG